MKRTTIILFAFLSSLAFAGDASKLKDLVGEWVSEAGGDVARIIIRADGDFDHSKHGRGDVEHQSGKRYKITVYNGNGNYIDCQVLVEKYANGDLQVTQLTNPNIGGKCDWGRLSRLSPGSGPAESGAAESAPEVSR